MFHAKSTRLLALVAVLSLAGCGGGDETATTTSDGDAHSGGEHAGHHGGHHGEGHGHGEWDAPSTVIAFHDVLAPAWHAEPGETRRAAICAAVADMRSAATGVRDAEAPDSLTGTPDEWAVAAGALVSAVDELGSVCASSPDTAEEQLSPVHDAFHALTGQLPGHDR